MSVRYIGSKARVAKEIGTILGPWDGRGRFVDAFCGTGVVAHEAAGLGWPVLLNDHLNSSLTVATAPLIGAEQVPFVELGGYKAAIDRLNGLPGARGFIWREYSPASCAGGAERRYFTEENASRIDAIRLQLTAWRVDRRISHMEFQLLLADLLVAANAVANIAGTYGCFLSHWTAGALRGLTLSPRELGTVPVAFEATCQNVEDLEVMPQDTVYLDPPYTKRQYAAYYHLLETIAEGDSPHVVGITGLRPWEHKASDFSYKSRALQAITSLVDRLPVPRVLLSYSDEGHVPLDELRRSLIGIGEVREHHIGTVGRYRPNEQASARRSTVGEYLIEVVRPAMQRRAPAQRLATVS